MAGHRVHQPLREIRYDDDITRAREHGLRITTNTNQQLRLALFAFSKLGNYAAASGLTIYISCKNYANWDYCKSLTGRSCTAGDRMIMWTWLYNWQATGEKKLCIADTKNLDKFPGRELFAARPNPSTSWWEMTDFGSRCNKNHQDTGHCPNMENNMVTPVSIAILIPKFNLTNTCGRLYRTSIAKSIIYWTLVQAGLHNSYIYYKPDQYRTNFIYLDWVTLAIANRHRHPLFRLLSRVRPG